MNIFLMKNKKDSFNESSRDQNGVPEGIDVKNDKKRVNKSFLKSTKRFAGGSRKGNIRDEGQKVQKRT